MDASAGKSAALGLATFSTGTWTAYGNLDGFEPVPYSNGLRRYEFNKLLAGALYGNLFGYSAYAGLPLHWTAKKLTDRSVHRVALGDLEFHLGKKIGKVRPKAGMILPLGYDRSDGDPWIGQGNVQSVLGLDFNANFSPQAGTWEAAADLEWAYSLTDGIAKAGSWRLQSNAKLFFRPRKEWRYGVEFSNYLKSSYWGRSAPPSQSLFGRSDRRADWKAGSVPSLACEYYLDRKTALGIKAGHSIWGYRDAAVYHGSLYVLLFK